MKPIEWIAAFTEALSNTQCRVSGSETTVDSGLCVVENLLADSRAHQGAVWWIGNGGSASICSHLSQDLINKLGIRSFVLSDSSLLTCMANDYGYEQVYSRPLSVLAQPGDLLIAISSGGRSRNILNSLDVARERNMKLISLSSFDPDNPLWQLPADVAFYLPTYLYGHAETGHQALLHSVIEGMQSTGVDS